MKKKAMLDPATRQVMLDRLEHLIQNPNYPAYTQYSPIHKFKRIHFWHYRLYVRVHTQYKAIIILAFQKDRVLKRNEAAGSLKQVFIDYLLAHEDFSLDHLDPLYPLPLPKENPLPLDHAEEDLFRSPEFRATKITEDDLSDLLAKKPGDPFVEKCINTIYHKCATEDRIMVEAVSTWGTLESEEVRRIQIQLANKLRLLELDYSSRFDRIAQKFIFVKKDKLAVYGLSRKGRLAGQLSQ